MTTRERLARLDPLGRLLAPVPATRTGALESVAVAVVAFLLASLRLGRTSYDGVVWAEDGPIFLQGAHEQGLLGALLDPYRGYAHVVARLAAEPVSHLPLTWQGVGISLAAVVVQALVALLVYHVVRAHRPGRPAAVVAALAVAVVPLGWEVIANVANSQWFLLAGAVLAPLWSPQRLVGRVGSALVLALACLSSPFAGLGAALACAVALCVRSRRSVVLAAVGVVALGVQALVMATAPARGDVTGQRDLAALPAGWLRRVVGDAVLGQARYGDAGAPHEAPGVLVGLLALLVLLAGAVALLLSGRGRDLVVPALLVVVGGLAYAAPAYLTSIDTTEVSFSGRYYVPPAVLLLVALAMLAEAAWTRDRSVGSDRRPLLLGAKVLTAALVAATAYGLVTSWQVPDGFTRYTDPSWSEAVTQARVDCDGRRPGAPAELWQSPSNWYVVLPCRVVGG
ncbi:MAG: hypothetical protein CMH83_13670 [Nocardioides sp.]|nr:hypothetical protein [Nocardioides sp.]